MKDYLAKFILVFSLLFLERAFASAPSPKELSTLFYSLDPSSLKELFAFYELYPEKEEGKKALFLAWNLLLSKEEEKESLEQFSSEKIPSEVGAIAALINKDVYGKLPELTDKELTLIERLAEHLPNRGLMGYSAMSEEEVWKIPSENVDVSKAMFFAQFGAGPETEKLRRTYLASIDLMAFQILAKLKKSATPLEKITAINHFIFDEMRFRFPPHSLYVKEIDEYTFLSSVLDSRRGVCLGVSILYLSLAQRLDLPLEVVTPPGHIYLRYKDAEKTINIETTARGINVPSDAYLGINTRSLQKRDLREVIGLSFVNQASIFWQKEEHGKALDAYKRALPYLPNDMLLKEFIAYQHIFLGNIEEGRALLESVKDYIPDYAVSKDTIAEDYLKGEADIEAMKAIFMAVDETQESIYKKRDALLSAVKRCPKFRAAYFHLGVTLLQLHKTKEASVFLALFHEMDPNDATTEYYLAIVYQERHFFKQAWVHALQAEKLAAVKGHHPKALTALKRELNLHFLAPSLF